MGHQTRRQAIVWTNGGLFTDVYMRHVASMSFKRDNQFFGIIASSKGDWKIPIHPEVILHNYTFPCQVQWDSLSYSWPNLIQDTLCWSTNQYIIPWVSEKLLPNE